MHHLIRLRATLCLIAVVLAVAIPGPVAVGAGDPAVVTGSRAGPVRLTSAFTTVGRLDLPAGRWLVFAHAIVSYDDPGIVPPFPRSECRLTIGTARHRMGFQLIDGTPGFTLMATGRIAVDGAEARLRCRELLVDTALEGIEMTAMEVGTVRMIPLDGGSATVQGSGGPEVWVGHRDAGVAISGEGDHTIVGTLELPAGRWLVLASLSLTREHNPRESTSCRLSHPSDRFLVQVDRADTYQFTFAWPLFALGAARLATETQVRFACRSTVPGTVARDTRLVAIRLGTLTTITLPSGPKRTTGSGGPRATIGSRSGPVSVPLNPGTVIAQVPVAAQGWLILGKTDLVAVEDPGGVSPITATCRIPGLGRRSLTTRISVPLPGGGSSSIVGALTFGPGAAAGLRCGTDPFGGGYPAPEARRMRVAAIRAASLTVVQLH